MVNLIQKDVLLVLCGTAAVSLYLASRRLRSREIKTNEKSAIVITGCDSGIGYSFARYAATSLKLVVFASVHNENSDGAQQLKNCEKIHVIPCDVRDYSYIETLKNRVEELVERHSYELVAVVNNAGVMTMGELEWQTVDQIENQIRVNLLGPVLVVKSFLPALRRFKARIVNVSSHCGFQSLPALSVYSSTKAALESFSSGLRMELEKFDVPIVSLVPGSYVTQSRILANLPAEKERMWSEMNEETRRLYKDHFNRFYTYLGQIPVSSSTRCIDDPCLMRVFRGALLEARPRRVYVNAPWRYTLYHLLFSLSPTDSIKTYFIRKFVALP